jgi:hypothetical protein
VSALPLCIILLRGQTGDQTNPRFEVTSLAAIEIEVKLPGQ